MKKLTITVSDQFYDDLRRTAGLRGMSRFVEQATAPHLAHDLDASYRAMAADGQREREASAWVDAECGATLPDDDWSWLGDEEGRGVVGQLRSDPRGRDQ